eukprot:scaffold175227_cov16-Tisochrysis_lutea.AAC.3
MMPTCTLDGRHQGGEQAQWQDHVHMLPPGLPTGSRRFECGGCLGSAGRGKGGRSAAQNECICMCV